MHSNRNHNNDTRREIYARKIHKRQKQEPKKNVQMHDEHTQKREKYNLPEAAYTTTNGPTLCNSIEVYE